METEKPSLILEEPARQMNGLFLCKLIRKYACLILITAFLGGVLAGLWRYVSATPTYTVQIRFLINTVHMVQDASGDEWCITKNPGDVTGASAVAAGACRLLGEDYALEQLRLHPDMQTDSISIPDKNAVLRMLSVSAEGQILTVRLTNPRQDVVLRAAKAAEQVIPAVVEHYYGVDPSLCAEQVGAVAVALTRISDPTADVTVSYTGRRVPLFACLGGCAAAIAAFLVALLRTYHDRRIYSARELGQNFNLPVWGQIPAPPRAFGSSGSLFSRRGREELPASALLTDGSPQPQKTAYEYLRLHLLHDTESPCPVYGIASVDRTGDTSILAANMALCCAALGKRVLLIDGNLRRSHPSSVFPDATGSGLSELLTGQCPKEKVCHHAAINSYLDIISGGSLPQNPTELLATPAMGELLQSARSRYDLVIVDLPPLGGYSDALVLQEHVTGYVLPVRAGHTDLDTLRATCETMEKVNAPMAGFVLTHTKKKNPATLL